MDTKDVHEIYKYMCANDVTYQNRFCHCISPLFASKNSSCQSLLLQIVKNTGKLCPKIMNLGVVVLFKVMLPEDEGGQNIKF